MRLLGEHIKGLGGYPHRSSRAQKDNKPGLDKDVACGASANWALCMLYAGRELRGSHLLGRRRRSWSRCWSRDLVLVLSKQQLPAAEAVQLADSPAGAERTERSCCRSKQVFGRFSERGCL